MSHSILIVEDDTELRKIYRMMLDQAGFQSTEAGNGKIALDLLEERVFDVMILDMLMPAMSGEMVLKRLQGEERHAHMKVLAVTAYASFRESVSQYNVAAFLVKPVRPKEVLEAIHRAMADNTPKTEAEE
jgi:DNA-binding NtrC family response regulator